MAFINTILSEYCMSTSKSCLKRLNNSFVDKFFLFSALKESTCSPWTLQFTIKYQIYVVSILHSEVQNFLDKGKLTISCGVHF
jgi:hypothetical protein